MQYEKNSAYQFPVNDDPVTSTLAVFFFIHFYLSDICFIKCIILNSVLEHGQWITALSLLGVHSVHAALILQSSQWYRADELPYGGGACSKAWLLCSPLNYGFYLTPKYNIWHFNQSLKLITLTSSCCKGWLKKKLLTYCFPFVLVFLELRF